MKLKKFANALWADDRGQSTTEYILILAVVVMIALKFKSTFGTQLSNIVNQLVTVSPDGSNGRPDEESRRL